MVARLLLVGDGDARISPGQGAERLQRILGLDETTFLGLERADLCAPKWDPSAAKSRAMTLLGGPWSLLVLFGARVRNAFSFALHRSFREWDAFKEPNIASCSTAVSPLKTLLCFPHPSGQCQAWNNEAAIDRARAMLRMHAPNVPWGMNDPEDTIARMMLP